MKMPQLIEEFCQAQRFALDFFPFLRARDSSFRVNAMLCATSFARSLVDADDRVPTPVFEKFGSGL